MKNVPYHEDVIEFGMKLTKLLTNYDICVEHEHSVSILIANKKVITFVYFNY